MRFKGADARFVFSRAAGIALAVSAASCGLGVSRFPPAANLGFTLKLATESTATQSGQLVRGSAGPLEARAGRGQIGSSSASGLTSLKLFVKSIAVCLDLTVTGGDFTDGLDCATLYSGPSGLDQSASGGDQSGLAQSARSTSSGFTDFTNDSARSGLVNQAGTTGVGAGSFNWGYIQWAPPIKVTATLFDLSQVATAPTLYTQDGTTAGTSGNPDFTYTTLSPTPFTAAPAAEAVVLEPTAGSWFRLLTPLTIAQADVNARNSFVVDLVFDPVGFVTGAAGTVVPGSVLSDGTNSIQVPPLELMPIAHAPGQAVAKESYVASVTDTDSNMFDVHLDIYYLRSDASQTIQATAIRAVPNTSSTTPIPGALSRVAFTRQNPDNTIDFLDYANNPIVTGITRGAATTGQIACQQGAAGMTSAFNPPSCTSSVAASFAAPTTSQLN